MNNEIGRKLASLILMTIMVAGGLTFAFPGFMPAAFAAHNANLFVSAENSQFDNYMSGPQVIEVVVIDPDIVDTDELKGEPDVTVNGKILRMVQGVDGNWYGYFADRAQSQIADSTVPVAAVGESGTGGVGLDFGTFCNSRSASIIAFDPASTTGFGDTVGVAFPFIEAAVGTNGSSTGATITASCTEFNDGGDETNGTANTAMNVLRESKSPSSGVAGVIGQIGLNASQASGSTSGLWPFIQLYTLNPTGNVIVQYNKGGGAQKVTLTFDTVDHLADLQLDRAKYPRNAQVHFTISDLWLNIDPTDEDSWSFGTNSSNATSKGAYYQVFDENGADAGSSIADGIINIEDTLDSLMCEDNCRLLFNSNVEGATTGDIVTVQDNDDSVIAVRTSGDGSTLDSEDAKAASIGDGEDLGRGSTPLTITELGPAEGIFGSYDESDVSALRTTEDAQRGKTASIDYNETPTSILSGFDFGTIDIQPVDVEWSSGEEIPVVLVDGDANKNSRADEDLDLNNPDVALIPSLKTGTPFTLRAAGSDDALNATFVGLGAEVNFSEAINDLPAGQFRILGALNHTTHINTGEDAEATVGITVQRFSDRAILEGTTDTRLSDVGGLVIDLEVTMSDVRASINDPRDDSSGDHDFRGFNLLNFDLRSLNSTVTDFAIMLIFNGTVFPNVDGEIIDDSNNRPVGNLTAVVLANVTSQQGLISLNSTSDEVADADKLIENLFDNIEDDDEVGWYINFTDKTSTGDGSVDRFAVLDERPIVIDLFSFGFSDDGVQSAERVSNQIVRIEAEETGDNTGTFEGSLEYVMINQLNILDESTFTDLSTIADDPSFIVIEDLTDEDAPRVNYLDLGADGVSTQIADQEAAPSHSGVVSFDKDSYKIADTVLVTLQDGDLNVDSDLIDIFTVVNDTGAAGADDTDAAQDAVGSADLPELSFGALGRLLDITFDDVAWVTQNDDCNTTLEATTTDTGLRATGFTLVETGIATGIFTGDFQIPPKWCRPGESSPETTTGLDLEVNFVDFRDASGEIIEVGDGAGIRANTGSVSLDRTVYPVPWGEIGDFADPAGDSTGAEGRSIFPIHASGINDGDLDEASETLGNGDLTIHIRVNDPDFDISAAGEDTIAQDKADSDVGPVKITVIRGANEVTLAYAGGSSANATGLIDVGDDGVDGCSFDSDGTSTLDCVRQVGAITEIAPDAGIFELDFTVRYTDGPASSTCPVTTTFTNLDGAGTAETDRFDTAAAAGEEYCILQGDIIQVEYTDPEDASGDVNTVTDSATFDLRNGVLQSDKSVYIIGSDMIMTLIEPDFDRDNDAAETYDLDLIEWDSDAATVTMGDADTEAAAFDPEPTDFRETGDSTGIFQIVIEIPSELEGDNLERGEEVVLEYTDLGPSGSDFVGDEDEDINLTIFTSNFGATVELDQKVYSWTDKVYITIVAPDHNFDSNLVDEIGDTDLDPIKVATRGNDIDNYKLVETGTDTGIFTGEVILTGFLHDADGDPATGDADGFDTDPTTSADGTGPTDGFLEADDDDGLTVSFEFSEDETVVGSALIRWNIGEVQWLEASYPATGTGVVRIIDPDMNLNPEAVDNFDVDVWSDSDAGGIDLTVTETNEATGIFEGTVFFTTTDESSGHRLRVAEGDTVTAEYEDNTLPDPYTTADELDITGTSLIGTIVPPLERAPASNARVVDAFGNALASVSVDQQVQITADLANGQDREQSFAYLVQVQDQNGVTVSLAWITGSLAPGQSFSPALSWTPDAAGTYTATVFVWESVDNPTALSPPVSVDITVQ